MSDETMRGLAVDPPLPADSAVPASAWSGMRNVGQHELHYIAPDNRALDNFSPMAQPIASIQWYCKSHRPATVLLVQDWSCYKAVVYKDEEFDQFRVGIMQLTVPAGQLVVISRNPTQKLWRGINYRVRVRMARITRCFRLGDSNKVPGAKALFELSWFRCLLSDELRMNKCDVRPGMYLNEAHNELHTNPQVFDGHGISIEPLLPESIRVAEYYAEQLSDVLAADATPKRPPAGSYLAAVLADDS